jgi:hypothetical protein
MGCANFRLLFKTIHQGAARQLESRPETNVTVMAPEEPASPAGFVRACSPGSTAIATRCAYCGESFVGPATTVQQFEEQHRQVCDRVVARAQQGS